MVAAEPVLVRARAPGPLGDVLDARLRFGDATAHGRGRAGAFGGGWIGYLGYSAGGEALPATGPRALPAWWFGYYDHVLRRDRATGEWYFEALWTRRAARPRSTARLAELTRRGRGAGRTAPRDYAFGPFRLVPGARAAPGGGPPGRWSTSTRVTSSRPTSRCAPRRSSPATRSTRSASGVTELDPPYAAFIGVVRPRRRARAAVASLSPELFLRRAGDTVASKPIKGTARRAGGRRPRPPRSAPSSRRRRRTARRT